MLRTSLLPAALLIAILPLWLRAQIVPTFGAPTALNSRATGDIGDDADQQIVHCAGTWITVWSANSAVPTSANDRDILVARSTDGGNTWSDQEVLNNNALTDEGDDIRPRLACAGEGALVIWQSSSQFDDTFSGDRNILVAGSRDGGLTWSDPVVVNSNAFTNVSAVPDLNPDIATDGAGTWVAVWESEDTIGGTVGTRVNPVFAVSTSFGATWTDIALLAINTENDIDFDLRPRLVASARGWLAVWQSADDLLGTVRTDRDIVASRSTDGARTWSFPIAVNSDADRDNALDLNPEPVANGDDVLVVWTSEFDLDGQIRTDRDILGAYSPDGGATWQPSVAVNNSANDDSEPDETPHVASDGAGGWMVVWSTFENLNGRLRDDADIVFALSNDNGTTWTDPGPVHANADIDNEADENPRIAGAPDGSWVGVWMSTETVGGATGNDEDLLFSVGLPASVAPPAAPPVCGASFGFATLGLVSFLVRRRRDARSVSMKSAPGTTH